MGRPRVGDDEAFESVPDDAVARLRTRGWLKKEEEEEEDD